VLQNRSNADGPFDFELTCLSGPCSQGGDDFDGDGVADDVDDYLAAADIGPDAPGRVILHGELWRAVADAAIPAGRRVVVQRVEGLTLHVAQEVPEDSAKQEGEPAAGDAAPHGPA